MAPRKPKRQADVLAALSADEGLAVLRALLQRHPELRDEARALATDRMVHIDRDAVAADLESTVGLLGLDELNARAGPHRDGYTDPTEAAWEILQEAIAPFVAELERLLKLSLEEAAQEQCEGVLLGLHQLLDRTGSGASPDEAGLLGWAPDFPGEAAGTVLETWSEAPGGPRQLDEDFLHDQLPQWVSLVERLRRRQEQKARRKR